MVGVFVEAQTSIELPFDTAVQALCDAMADGGLVAESRRAAADGLVFVMPVGPRGSQIPANEVMVQLLSGSYRDQTFVVPLRWEATGHSGRLFPALDASIELTGGDQPQTSRLSIIGRYEPPLSKLGEALDRAVMSRVASATINALVRETANRLERMT